MIMKTSIICFITILVGSGCYYQEKNVPNTSDVPMTREDEIRKIMRNHWINSNEKIFLNSFDLYPQLQEDLRNMKEDYYYDINDRDSSLTIPGPKWTIRGPLTIEQVEQETLDDEIKKYPDVPQVPFGFQNKEWKKLKSKYKDGDEFFFYWSDPVSWFYLRGESGYVLIRQNKVVDKIVCRIS
jgi:hypothetical protein